MLEVTEVIQPKSRVLWGTQFVSRLVSSGRILNTAYKTFDVWTVGQYSYSPLSP